MAVTANGTPYVETSDLVANYPGVSLALANHIDANTGKVLQVVRATDTTNRSTTAAAFVDVTGMSVTITPQQSTSALLIIAIAETQTTGGTDMRGRFRLTDSSNNPLSGAQDMRFGGWGVTAAGFVTNFNIVGYATPATTSPVTYKLQFGTQNTPTSTTTVTNASTTGQMYAIEVSA